MISSPLNNLLIYKRHECCVHPQKQIFLPLLRGKSTTCGPPNSQRKILEKLTVTETGHKLRLLQRKSRRERDYENCTKSQTKGICGKAPFVPKLWREVVFLLISLSRCRRRGEFYCGLLLKKREKLRLFLLPLKIKCNFWRQRD